MSITLEEYPVDRRDSISTSSTPTFKSHLMHVIHSPVGRLLRLPRDSHIQTAGCSGLHQEVDHPGNGRSRCKTHDSHLHHQAPDSWLDKLCRRHHRSARSGIAVLNTDKQTQSYNGTLTKRLDSNSLQWLLRIDNNIGRNKRLYLRHIGFWSLQSPTRFPAERQACS